MVIVKMICLSIVTLVVVAVVKEILTQFKNI